MSAHRRLTRSLAEHPWLLDALLITVITAIAAALRLALLGDVPHGLHPDEAQVGTDAHRLLDGQWIGAYTSAALGQPAGHAYLTAPSVRLFGDTPFAVRLPLALVAIAAVPLLYALARIAFGRIEACFASALLAVSYWHLLYSRVAHWSISYGTVLLAVMLCTLMGMRSSGRWPWFLAAGALLGLGAYTYNIYPIAVVAFAAFVAVTTVTRRRSPGGVPPWWWGRHALLVGAGLVIALPLIIYISDPGSQFWDHLADYRSVAVWDTPEYDDASPWGKARLLAGQAKTFAAAYAWDGHPDDVDGNGLRPVFEPLTLALIVAGAAIAMTRRREPLVVAALCCIAILPLPAVLQRGSIMRQPVAAAPWLMLLAALPLAAVWREAMLRRAAQRALLAALTLAVLALVTGISVRDYFWTWRESPFVRKVYFPEMTAASDYMRDLPPDAYVYFYSDRASIDLETRQFLAPGVRGENRSREFSDLGASIEAIDRSRPAVFVLLEPYIEKLPDIEERHPGGVSRIVARHGAVEFAAYELPPIVAVSVPPGSRETAPP